MSQKTKLHIFLLIEMLAVAAVAAAAASCFAWTDALQVTVGLLPAYALPCWLVRRDKHATLTARLLLLLVWLLLSAAAIFNLQLWTGVDGYSMEIPHLLRDDSSYYRWAYRVYHHEPPHKTTFVGLPLLMVGMWKVLGVSVVWPIVMNVLMMMLAVVAAAKTVVTLLEGRVKTPMTTAFTVAVLLAMGLFFLLSQAVRVQKEASCALSVTLVGYTLARLTARDTLTRKDMAIYIAGTLLLALVRTSFVYFVLTGVVLLMLGNWRSRWRRGVLLAVIAVVAFAAGAWLSLYPFSQQANTIAGGDAMQRYFIIGYAQQPYLEMIGNYFHYPVWKRVLLLPFTCAVQFVIPFPWVYEPLGRGYVMEIMPRVRCMWYAVGGLVVFYYLFVAWRRDRGGLGVWALWPAAVFVIIAYITGGSVSRYVLPFELLFLPMAVFVLFKVKEGEYRGAFVVWMVAFSFVLLATLLICHEVQIDYLNGLERYYQDQAALHK